MPAENTFTPKGQTTPDYSRGDALVTLAPSAFTTNNVAELDLDALGNATGAGSWAVSAPLTLAGAGSVSLSFGFTNQLTVINAGPLPAIVQASYSYTFNLQDSSGALVFSSAPAALNHAISLIAPGSVSLPGSGTVTITSGTLAAGSYTMTLSGTENVFANVTPEPAGLLLFGTGSSASGERLAADPCLRRTPPLSGERHAQSRSITHAWRFSPRITLHILSPHSGQRGSVRPRRM